MHFFNFMSALDGGKGITVSGLRDERLKPWERLCDDVGMRRRGYL